MTEIAAAPNSDGAAVESTVAGTAMPPQHKIYVARKVLCNDAIF